MGINVFHYKLVSFTIGAFFAGIGGALLASLVSTIDPKMFLFTLTFNVLMIVVTGGLGSITGSVLASIIITILLEWLRFVENPIYFGDFELKGIPGMRMVVFSLALIIIILFRREGLMGMREFKWEWILGMGRKRGEAK
jgi:branched-chain amino acid transport system permease protein